MKPGTVVKVTTSRIGGGQPTIQFPYVAEENWRLAEKVVKDGLPTTPDQQVEAVAPLPANAVDGLGLKPGKFCAYS